MGDFEPSDPCLSARGCVGVEQPILSSCCLRFAVTIAAAAPAARCRRRHTRPMTSAVTNAKQNRAGRSTPERAAVAAPALTPDGAARAPTAGGVRMTGSAVATPLIMTPRERTAAARATAPSPSSAAAVSSVNVAASAMLVRALPMAAAAAFDRAAMSTPAAAVATVRALPCAEDDASAAATAAPSPAAHTSAATAMTTLTARETVPVSTTPTRALSPPAARLGEHRKVTLSPVDVTPVTLHAGRPPIAAGWCERVTLPPIAPAVSAAESAQSCASASATAASAGAPPAGRRTDMFA